MLFKFFRNRKVGQQNISIELQQFNFINNFLRIVQRFGQVAERFEHFRFGFEIEFIVEKRKSCAFGHRIGVIKILIGGGLFIAGVHTQ